MIKFDKVNKVYPNGLHALKNISLEISESLIWGMLADCFKYKNMSDTSDKIVDYMTYPYQYESYI